MLANSGMEQTQMLLKQKDTLENEIRDLELELKSHNASTTTALVDEDGFPRSDIDIATIRQIRRSLIYKQNDLRELMGQVESSLVGLHQNTRHIDNGDGAESEVSVLRRRPFARISMVAPDSPASESGMAAGDKIVNYGSVDETNHDGLRQLIIESTNNIQKPISVVVDRVVDGQPQTKTLVLTPRRGWGGDGLLGCYITPL